ncbi:hypothetical protein PILCRDRAFT_84701 [Piloderma croceum F 1598]|uniref:Uncharacterized protein n=1 Tax=Piloderma croceum (strain F 1598) TaxID=765440 RepID=A0A0C3BTG5_PILCF|nr:hypothetical protein PILCRDRAFT_84701 [Piloderma croceum F 1598]
MSALRLVITWPGIWSDINQHALKEESTYQQPGHLFTEKCKTGGGGEDVEGGGSDLDGAEQTGDLDHDKHNLWYTENMEDDNADDKAHQDEDKESILSIMSMDEDVPTLNESSLNLLLNSMQKVIQRGKSAVAKGIKATYAVKVGQKQSGRSERREKSKKQTEYEEGLRGGNQLENWFKKQTEVEADVVENGSDEDITAGSSRSQAIKLQEASEESKHDDETATLPPSTRALSPAISTGGEVESGEPEPEHAITDSPSHDQEFGANAQPLSDLSESELPSTAVPNIASLVVARASQSYEDVLVAFVDSMDGWITSSLAIAHAVECGLWLARKL